MLIPDTVKAVEQAKTEIRLAEEEELINFYSKALSLLLWVRDGYSGINRFMVYRMVRDQRKTVYPFPYNDLCLPIADWPGWSDLMWSTKGIYQIKVPGKTIKHDKELKAVEAADAINKLTATSVVLPVCIGVY